MKVLIYGLGAVGTAFATFLKNKGLYVSAIIKEKYINKINENTVSVDGIWGFHKAKLDEITSSVDLLKEKNYDVIIISVKSYDTKTAVFDIKKIFNKNTYIILAQNGYGNYEIAKQILPAENILLARVIFGSKVLKPACVQITVNADDVVIGQPENLSNEESIQNIVNTIDTSGIPTRYDKDVYKILWDKILYNCALNPLGAILECKYGDLAENKETRDIMDNIIFEIFDATRKNNIELNWKNPKDYLNFFYERLVPPTKDHFPSMYYDLKSGKKTEIDALNGAIVELAKKVDIKVPVNELITNLVKAKYKLKTS